MKLTSGMPILYGGNRMTIVPEVLARAFQDGDHLLVVQESGDLLHVTQAEHARASDSVARALLAFRAMGQIPDTAVSRFFEAFATRLEDAASWTRIAEANAQDVAAARRAGRSVTRLAISERMRDDMIAGLRAWRDAVPSRGRVLERIDHDGWSVEQVTAPLGVVGFVFEGRPNVLADAAGVLRGGNTAVLRIGSDALGTAQAIMCEAVAPALAEAGLPDGALCLVASTARAAGWALFSDRRLALAVARGSGAAVAQLGSVARQSGVPVSLHGTGGAWLVAAADADTARFAAAVRHSLDRKVCNTLNVCCIDRTRPDLVTVLLDSLLEAAGANRKLPLMHVVEDHLAVILAHLEDRRIEGQPSDWETIKQIVSAIPEETLACEWEWEDRPEISVTLVEDLDQAADLFNRYAPRFVASLISGDRETHRRFFGAVDAPFVGDGFTRWVDGQYALDQPELGLSNWEAGRTFARGGILSGNGVYTIRTRARQDNIMLHR